MRPHFIPLSIATILCASAGAATAEDQIVLKKDALYFGAGAGVNSTAGSDNAIGLQFFGGYVLPVDMKGNVLSLEAGYMDSGNFNGGVSAEGLWVNGVIDIPLKNELSVLGRAGFDFGDDDGLMLGAGFGMGITDKVDARAEFVIRDNIDSLQLNLIYRL